MNNFDKSSIGENIEFFCEYDTDLACMYFDEFINNASGDMPLKAYRDRRGTIDYIVIGDLSEKKYKKAELQKLIKTELHELCIRYDLIDSYLDISAYKKDELISCLLALTLENVYDFLYDEKNSRYDLPYDFNSCGYSQGDSVLINILDNAPFKPSQAYIDNILWDCPIYIRANINNVDYYEDSFLSDNYYEWNRGSIIENIKKLNVSDYAKNWLIQHLPDYPKYN